MSEQVHKIRMVHDRYVDSHAGVIKLGQGDEYVICYAGEIHDQPFHGSQVRDNIAVNLLNDGHAEPANDVAPEAAQYVEQPATDPQTEVN